MKSKKKVGLVKRIAAGVCLLVILFYVFDDVNFKANVSLDSYLEFCDVPVFLTSDGLYSYNSSYNYVVCYESSNNRLLLYEFHGSYNFYILNGRPVFEKNGGASYSLFSYSFKGGMWTYGSANLNNSTSLACYIGEELMSEATYFFTSCDIFDNDKLENIVYDGGFSIKNGVTSDVFGETYNSSLGYLQNVQRKNLTLDDENYDPDYDSWQVMFTFDSTSTTGLDITTGSYSVRHFMNWEVRDRDSNVVRSYDKVSCGEYDAASCKISYPLYSTRQAAMEESGFESLSWWESGVLGYEVYIYDYLQLVRTNEDGSVEYGGYVKIDENGYVADTLDDNFIEDPDGYLDKNVPVSSGSGSNYEDAEHDADENASNSSNPNGDALGELDDMLSLISFVPNAFARMFSFLPDWCLNSYGVFVAFGLVILLWKVAR